MNAKAGISPAPRNSPTTTVALLHDVVARLTRALEALEDREPPLAEAIVGDLPDPGAHVEVTADVLDAVADGGPFTPKESGLHDREFRRELSRRRARRGAPS